MNSNDPYKGVRALVLGGSGFIGSWMVRALAARGAVVSAVIRDRGRAQAVFGRSAESLGLIEADLASPGAAASAVCAARADVVFNLAGYGVDRSERDPRLMDALNARLVDELCRELATNPEGEWTGARLVHAGSALEYGRIDGRLSEEAETRPTSAYGRTKLQATQLVAAAAAASGLRAVVARLFTIYGPGEHSDRLLPALLHTARTGARLGLTGGRQRRNFTYVEDVVEGLLRLGTLGLRGEVVNVATDRLCSVREFAETAADVLGFDRKLLDFGALPDLEDEMWHGDVDVSRLRDLTSWLPRTSVADGIRRTWELMREQ